jgi:hypothetical protein
VFGLTVDGSVTENATPVQTSVPLSHVEGEKASFFIRAMIEEALLPGRYLAQVKEGIKGSRLRYDAPRRADSMKFSLSPTHQPPWAFESKNLKAKKSKFESSWIRFSLSN